jgi:hypothetical protein
VFSCLHSAVGNAPPALAPLLLTPIGTGELLGSIPSGSFELQASRLQSPPSRHQSFNHLPSRLHKLQAPPLQDLKIRFKNSSFKTPQASLQDFKQLLPFKASRYLNPHFKQLLQAFKLQASSLKTSFKTLQASLQLVQASRLKEKTSSLIMIQGFRQLKHLLQGFRFCFKTWRQWATQGICA